MEDISRWVREHPWPALGIALGAGIAAGILLPGLARLTGDALTTLSGAPKQTSPEKSAEQVERQS